MLILPEHLLHRGYNIGQGADKTNDLRIGVEAIEKAVVGEMATGLVYNVLLVCNGIVIAVYAFTAKAHKSLLHELCILRFELSAFCIVVPGSIDELQHAASGRCVEARILVHEILEDSAADTGQGTLEEYFIGQVF